MLFPQNTYINKYSSTIKQDEMLPFVTTWISLVVIMLSEIDQVHNDSTS